MRTQLFLVACLLLALFGLVIPIYAQSGGVYEIWGNVGAGGTVSGGAYEVAASIGQPEAGQIGGGAYTLGGGFWGGGAVIPASGGYQVFLPLVIR